MKEPYKELSFFFVIFQLNKIWQKHPFYNESHSAWEHLSVQWRLNLFMAQCPAPHWDCTIQSLFFSFAIVKHEGSIQLFQRSPDISAFTVIGQWVAMMYNPTSHSVYMLCQQPGSSSSSEAAKESTAGGQTHEMNAHWLVLSLICVFVGAGICECTLKVVAKGHVLLWIRKISCSHRSARTVC